MKFLNCGGSYVPSPDWIKNKNTRKNCINVNNKCSQYAERVVSNK